MSEPAIPDLFLVLPSCIAVKVCGITRAEDATTALALGAHSIGINLYTRSPRSVSLEKARRLFDTVPKGKRVLVDVATPAKQLEIYGKAGFDFFQIHFELTLSLSTLATWSEIVGPEKLWLAPRLVPGEPFPETTLPFAQTLVLDTYSKKKYGGTGKTGNWDEFCVLQDRYPEKNWILAGGLNPENIVEALRVSGARMVDVNSGVESAPGIKEPDKLRLFFKNLHRASEL